MRLWRWYRECGSAPASLVSCSLVNCFGISTGYYGQLRLLKISCSHPDNTNNITGPVTDRSVCCRARLLPHYLSRSPESRYSRTVFKQGEGHWIQLIFEHLKNLSILITYDKSLEFNFTNFLVRKRLRRRWWPVICPCYHSSHSECFCEDETNQKLCTGVGGLSRPQHQAPGESP